MKTRLLAAVAIFFSGLACADVPAGPDSVNGSFVRMLRHGPGVAPMRAIGGDSTDLQFERWVNAAARGDTTSLEAGFANLLARADDAPTALPAHGVRDLIEVMITQALQAQRLTVQQHSRIW
jgi:hypothetical protein